MKRNIAFFCGMIFVPLIFSSCLNDGSLYSEDDDTSIESSISIPQTNVMLQGFTWSSNSASRTGATKSWYEVVQSNAGQIAGTFEYVWFPPASESLSSNGYLPRELNNLNSAYGMENSLKSAISSISPAKAIGDIVINHRVGSKSWGDFTNPSFGTVLGSNYKAICSDDEGFTSDPNMSKVPSSMRGSSDTGDGYASGRDLDHTNAEVQEGIITWMNSVMKGAGFVGWRYDYVRGFNGKYVGYYNAKTDAAFSVGEMWPDGFSTSGTAWKSKMTDWVSSTEGSVNGTQGKKSRVFDFVLKGMLNSVFGTRAYAANGNYSLLASESNIFRALPAYAVTFVDNHDTGSTQGLWPLDPSDIGAAYALILTHPGYPCVAWQHYFTSGESDDTSSSANSAQYLGGKIVPGTERTYKNHIRYLISLRASCGINEESTIQVLEANTSGYLAKVTGTKGSVVLSLGKNYPAPTGYAKAYSGTGFEIFTEE